MKAVLKKSEGKQSFLVSFTIICCLQITPFPLLRNVRPSGGEVFAKLSAKEKSKAKI